MDKKRVRAIIAKIPEDLYERIAREAERTDRTVSAVVRVALKHYFEVDEDDQPAGQTFKVEPRGARRIALNSRETRRKAS